MRINGHEYSEADLEMLRRASVVPRPADWLAGVSLATIGVCLLALWALLTP